MYTLRYRRRRPPPWPVTPSLSLLSPPVLWLLLAALLAVLGLASPSAAPPALDGAAFAAADMADSLGAADMPNVAAVDAPSAPLSHHPSAPLEPRRGSLGAPRAAGAGGGADAVVDAVAAPPTRMLLAWTPNTGTLGATGAVPGSMLIAATLDGALHAVARDSGRLLWTSWATGGALVHTLPGTSSFTSDMRNSLAYLVDPTGDAPLFVHAPGAALTRLPVSLKALAGAAPFRARDGSVYTGSRHTRIFAIDARTGRLLRAAGGGSGFSHASQGQSATGTTTDPLPIFLGRTDYHVVMHPPGANGNDGQDGINIHVSEYASARMEWTAAHDASDHDDANNGNTAVAFGLNGDLILSSPSGQVVWAIRFATPPVAVFDVAPASHAHDPLAAAAGFHILRRAHLTFPPSVLPGDGMPATAFVGQLPQSGALYVLSSRTHFPGLRGELLPLWTRSRRADGDSASVLLLDASSDHQPPSKENKPPYGHASASCQVGSLAVPQCIAAVHARPDSALGLPPSPPSSSSNVDSAVMASASTPPASASDMVVATTTTTAAHADDLILMQPNAQEGEAVGPAIGAIVVISEPPPSPPAPPPPVAPNGNGDSGAAGAAAAHVKSGAAGSSGPATKRRLGPSFSSTNQMIKIIDVEVEVSPQIGFGFGVAVTLLVGGLSLLVYQKLRAMFMSRREKIAAKRAAKAAAATSKASASDSSSPTSTPTAAKTAPPAPEEQPTATPPPPPPAPETPPPRIKPPSLVHALATFVQQYVFHYLTRMNVVGGMPGMYRPSPSSPPHAPSEPSSTSEATATPGDYPSSAPYSSGGTPSSTPHATATPSPNSGSSGSGTRSPMSPSTPGYEMLVTPIAQPDGTTRLGRLLLTDQVLGYGSHGTVVYRGTYDGREVAVKRLLRDFYDVAQHEVALLVESDDHYNVVRYYCKEQCDRFLYIALELCDCSLADVVEGTAAASGLGGEEIRNGWNPSRILYQVLSGLHHLHALKIVHRDLKPHNILLVRNRRQVWNPAGARVLISDFGLCKKLELDQSSFGNTATHNGGTFGWRAPELLTHPTAPTTFSSHSSIDKPSSTTSPNSASATASDMVSAVPNGSSTSSSVPRRRLTRALDVFSLGCLFYYVLTGGEHPFGDRYSREINILRGQSDLSALDTAMHADAPIARALVASMIAHDVAARPTTAQLLVHPFFWTPARRLNFLADVSDRFEVETKDPPSPLVQRLESGAELVVEGDWTARIDRSLANNLGKFRKYRGESVVDLLRGLRNKKHHYADLPPAVRRALGPLPDGFLQYFTDRFPNLFLHVYGVVRDTPELLADSLLGGYFSSEPDEARGSFPV